MEEDNNMASKITGNAKFFYKNYLLGLGVASITVSSGNADYLNDNDRETKWISSGSNDTITETITVEFSTAKTVDRLMALVMNWKEFNIQYWNGSAYVDFTNVYSKKDDSPVTGISYTDNEEPTRYWEFDSVSTLKIRYEITKTFIVDAEKCCQELFISQEIGTFEQDFFSDPNKNKPSFDDGEIIITLSNMSKIQLIRGDKYQLRCTLKNVWESNDISILVAAFDIREVAFLANGAFQDDYEIPSWRLQDLYNGLIIGKFTPEHTKARVKDVGYNFKFDFSEV